VIVIDQGEMVAVMGPSAAAGRTAQPAAAWTATEGQVIVSGRTWPVRNLDTRVAVGFVLCSLLPVDSNGKRGVPMRGQALGRRARLNGQELLPRQAGRPDGASAVPIVGG
jgi:hypothetical protein